MADPIESAVARVGPRLRLLRRDRRVTLAVLAARTGISASTLSRLETGGRRPTLELLLTLARAYRLPLDELVPRTGSRSALASDRPFRLGRATLVPLSRETRGVRAFVATFDGGERADRFAPRVHDGFIWLYVLRGRIRLTLDGHELELEPGEVAEFSTRAPHRLGAAGGDGAELLMIFAAHGEPPRVRARTTRAVT